LLHEKQIHFPEVQMLTSYRSNNFSFSTLNKPVFSTTHSKTTTLYQEPWRNWKSQYCFFAKQFVSCTAASDLHLHADVICQQSCSNKLSAQTTRVSRTPSIHSFNNCVC